MRGALFGDQVDGYKDAFVYNGVYEIANAPIKACDPQWKMNPTDMDYQMTFGRQTIIQPIDAAASAIVPQYQTISQLPRFNSGNEKFDVIGVVIYIDEQERKVTTAQQKQLSVREIVVTDHSVQQPLIISAWNDLAEVDCDSLSASSGKLQVVGFTALRVSPHKGFSLATTMSTTIIQSPQGGRADGLREWVSKHRKLLTDMQSRVVDVRKPGNDETIKKIATLKMRKAQNTLQEERHWLRVTIPEPELNQINAYLGCSNCGKRADVPAGHVYSCAACSVENITCSPKVTFNSDVSDGSGTLSMTAFTDDAVKLFRMDAAEIFKMKNYEDHVNFKQIKESMQTVPILIQMGPKATLSRNNILQ
ncbi:hypothetical protein RND81_04G023500 [Saponaria officinalis]|uniref:Uncharacterized protein n=1 Tax=Saponaria officinalis TaxID=3572 RepID=A0AAW1LIK5_SAPOF